MQVLSVLTRSLMMASSGAASEVNRDVFNLVNSALINSALINLDHMISVFF